MTEDIFDIGNLNTNEGALVNLRQDKVMYIKFHKKNSEDFKDTMLYLWRCLPSLHHKQYKEPKNSKRLKYG